MEDFIKKNYGVARYHRTAGDAFKDAEYANPYSVFKKPPNVMARFMYVIIVIASVAAWVIID